MKYLKSYLPYILAVLFIAIIFSIYIQEKKPNASGEQKSETKIAESQIAKPSDRVQVFLFHATKRCTSCISIGKFAKETIEKKFPEELTSGKIEFREINIDLPENKELATKFKATGSAFFINVITNDNDNISEDAQVWRFVSDKESFISYLSDKIKTLL